MKKLLSEIRACQVCHEELPFGARPVLSASQKSRILVIGQAPGRIVHETGIPWNDRSGENLRKWLSVTPEQFYDTNIFGIIPMGFCYPCTGKNGDFPPRKECAPLWHQSLIDEMKDIKLMLLIGQYAQRYYLGKSAKKNLTTTVQSFDEYLPKYFPLPHPSPRNNIWQKKNPWFQESIIPILQEKVMALINH